MASMYLRVRLCVCVWPSAHRHELIETSLYVGKDTRFCVTLTSIFSLHSVYGEMAVGRQQVAVTGGRWEGSKVGTRTSHRDAASAGKGSCAPIRQHPGFWRLQNNFNRRPASHTNPPLL